MSIDEACRESGPETEAESQDHRKSFFPSHPEADRKKKSHKTVQRGFFVGFVEHQFGGTTHFTRGEDSDCYEDKKLYPEQILGGHLMTPF